MNSYKENFSYLMLELFANLLELYDRLLGCDRLLQQYCWDQSEKKSRKLAASH